MKPFTSLLQLTVRFDECATIVLECDDGVKIRVAAFDDSSNQFSIAEGDAELTDVGVNRFEKIIDSHGGIFDVVMD